MVSPRGVGWQIPAAQPTSYDDRAGLFYPSGSMLYIDGQTYIHIYIYIYIICNSQVPET